MHILYLTYDMNDPATEKRVRMLRVGGATVHVAGFHRTPTHPDTVTNFGRTYNGRFFQRSLCVLRQILLLYRHREIFVGADIVIARNLEMLAITVCGRRFCATQPRLVYECLDIHRLLLRNDLIGTVLRALEGWLTRSACLLITSSPAFISEYFEKHSRVHLPVMLLENKVLLPEEPVSIECTPCITGPPWRIGWFGVIRCKQSLKLLSQLALAHPHHVEIIIRGNPAYDQLDDFDTLLKNIPNIHFLGAYRNPDDLKAIYSEVHFNWAIDRFEEGENSTWLLPNRLYEGGLFGAVPLVAPGVETSHFTENLGIGYTLDALNLAALSHFIESMTPETYRTMHAAVKAVPLTQWAHTQADCAALVARLAPPTLPPLTFTSSVLIVIPCLNEAAFLEPLVSALLTESTTLPMRIVLADGGSTDGTVEIAKRLAKTHALVTYLHNPKRLQSAAVNLAVARYGNDSEILIRMDGHANYPQNFCHTLIEEAIQTGADSVVISMHSVAARGFQAAVAAAQNSMLGNGGAAHRRTQRSGHWVDHGHHALMRMGAYRAVGGYDESFSHNEDAELDTRLRQAGFRIWLTAKTSINYVPRTTAHALFQQYRQYGIGRAHHLRKHLHFPKLRHILPLAVAPVIAFCALAPLITAAALPFIAWMSICLLFGALLAYRTKNFILLLSGPAAMLMHSGWSIGFWQGIFTYKKGPPNA